ncbi:YlbF family regulator [Alicyclobacillus cycloheptanicus]|uniref:Cell fate (Sporulation/competence/biofilm development) regulator YmcA (YheA/YmcA/DUF963 family) n=1 Tax=Alicyclobacillus cycloheptanicus TaxID=1457 RepID=A0ABT9XG92_9BACL|nr:YlbF family regulator [Alicyclobacillus cycloheptanicus]MDQ0189309.1 cell fate (sporulation/competence/biofilm development) regulator YmcA (YheA/YmcA/DUF963 family) [Alicyclobacillus cycloheptanicus]WDM01329.1 YlbF family regulator [Alicyclobacillus cycloheptanicus]
MNRDRLEQKAAQIALTIARSEAAARYWQARDKMETHTRAQELYDELKLKTNARMILEERLPKDHPKVMLAKLEEQEAESKLREIPVALQYQEAKDELNEMVQGVVQLLLRRLSTYVPVEPGPRQGCGKGHGGAGCDCGK